MFRHKGQKRTFKHNLKLAVLLSATAGIVNVAGFMSFAIFTTNVTGHVAQFAKELSEGNFYFAKIIFLWMFLFLFGAFFSSVLIEVIGKRQPRLSHTVPLLLEALILLCVGYVGETYQGSILVQHILAGSLLFAMGMQNAMVSMVSGFVVRTTHLTGLFTDLGIELSQIIFRRKDEHKELSKKTILHSSIILMFITGGIASGYIYHLVHYKVFIIAALILLVALFYDSTRMKIYIIRRKMRRG
jgi:uncharacterized membrane protein YoaK (UPF0700 family)